MPSACRVIVADGPDGELFACIDGGARYVEPSVARTRFAAVLHPFQYEERALAALIMAGGRNPREHRK